MKWFLCLNTYFHGGSVLCVVYRLLRGKAYDVLVFLQEAAGNGAALKQFLRAVRYAALRRQVFGGMPLTRDNVAQTLGIRQVSDCYSPSFSVAQITCDTYEQNNYQSAFRIPSMLLFNKLSSFLPQVVARGMGLQMGVVGRWARFSLYVDSDSEGSLVVEVRSDRGDYGCCHVTSWSTSPGAATAKANYKVILGASYLSVQDHLANLNLICHIMNILCIKFCEH